MLEKGGGIGIGLSEQFFTQQHITYIWIERKRSAEGPAWYGKTVRFGDDSAEELLRSTWYGKYFLFAASLSYHVHLISRRREFAKTPIHNTARLIRLNWYEKVRACLSISRQSEGSLHTALKTVWSLRTTVGDLPLIVSAITTPYHRVVAKPLNAFRKVN